MFKKDLRFYENRLSKQILKIGILRNQIEEYFHDSYQKCANREFTEDTLKAFRRGGGQPRDDTIEIYGDIDKDIETMYVFLNRWETSLNIDKKTMKLGKRLYNELVRLKNYIENTPPDMIAGVKNIILQKRLGGY